jgi:3-hydroxyacyl-[acyl-carrier-protein] dehydratase
VSPLEHLPHRPPFLFLDRVVLLEPGRRAVASKAVSHDDPWVDGDGRWPGVLLAEVLAQVAGLAAAGEARETAVVVKIDRFRCRRTPVAGDVLVATARVVRRFGASALVRGSLRAGGRRCAAAEIALRFGA